MISISTINDLLENRYRLHGQCRGCGKQKWIDLHALKAQGLGERIVCGPKRKHFKCECGQRIEIRLSAADSWDGT